MTEYKLPEPVAWMMNWPNHGPSFTTNKSDYVYYPLGGRPAYPEGLSGLHSAAQLQAAYLAGRESMREEIKKLAKSFERIDCRIGSDIIGDIEL